MDEDYFDYKLALNGATGNVVPGAEGVVYAIEDTAFLTPLPITDLSGVPLAKLIASPTGIYPPFKVPSGETRVNVVSGPMVTPVTSAEGSRGVPGPPGEPAVGLPPAATLPDGYIPVVASGTWTAAPAPSGGGGGGTSSMLEVYWVEGQGWPTLPATPPPGVKSRWFLGGPSRYTGAVWPGVRDFFVLSET